MSTSAAEPMLWSIALLGGAGAMIDFYIGKSGQRRVKEWLEIEWYRFHRVEWHNFGENEARYYIGIVDRLFGAALLSRRRLLSTITVTLLIVVFLGLVTMVDIFQTTDAGSAWLIAKFFFTELVVPQSSW